MKFARLAAFLFLALCVIAPASFAASPSKSKLRQPTSNLVVTTDSDGTCYTVQGEPCGTQTEPAPTPTPTIICFDANFLPYVWHGTTCPDLGRGSF